MAGQLHRHGPRYVGPATVFWRRSTGQPVRCNAQKQLIVRARALGLPIRAGIHTGECEVRGDRLAGITLHLAARVVTLAGAEEILTTSTVRDLVNGSGLTFRDRGAHSMKGFDGQIQVLAVDQ